MKSLICCCAVIACSAGVSAEIIGVTGGMPAPAPTLGPYDMTPFPLDGRPTFTDVDFVPSPLGGELEFSVPLSHRRIGEGFADWSHGYRGDVYLALGDEVTLALPPDTFAFYFYGNHDHGASDYVTAEADDGTTIQQLIQGGGSGASYYGFYQDDPLGDPLRTIRVSITRDYFAVGEFGIAVPEPSSLLLLLAGAGISLRRTPR